MTAAAGATAELRLGTRGSALALAQAQLVARALEEASPGLGVEIVPIKVAGDEATARRPPAPRADVVPDDKSRFVKEIESALLAKEIDLAVHSAKDVPGSLPDGLAIVAVPERADARDALCGAIALDALPEGATVGTSSLRRRSQLLARRPDLRVAELRGNVDTRLRRLEEGDFAAIVVAAAGLDRLDRGGGAALPAGELTPAPGQGCLALEARADAGGLREVAGRVTHRDSLVRLTAERALVDALDASCRTPIGAHCELDGGEISLSAFVGLPDGSAWIRDAITGEAGDPGGVGRSAAERLLSAGAGEMLAKADAWDAGGAGRSV